MSALIIGGIVCALVLVPLAYLARQFIKAPLAYQDDARGYVLGEPDEHSSDDNLGI